MHLSTSVQRGGMEDIPRSRSFASAASMSVDVSALSTDDAQADGHTPALDGDLELDAEFQRLRCQKECGYVYQHDRWRVLPSGFKYGSSFARHCFLVMSSSARPVTGSADFRPLAAAQKHTTYQRGDSGDISTSTSVDARFVRSPADSDMSLGGRTTGERANDCRNCRKRRVRERVAIGGDHEWFSRRCGRGTGDGGGGERCWDSGRRRTDECICRRQCALWIGQWHDSVMMYRSDSKNPRISVNLGIRTLFKY